MFVQKLTLTMMILTTSTLSIAGGIAASCVADNTALSCARSKWKLGVQALYLNPSYSSPFSQTSTASIPPLGPFGPSSGPLRLTSNSVMNKNNPWSGGFKLEAVYYVLSENDLSLSWFHYNHSTTQSLLRGAGLNNFIQDELSNAAFFSDVTNFLKIKWDAVNLEIGKYVHSNNRSKLRVHGGFQYANIQTTNNNTTASVNTASNVYEYVNISDSDTHMNYSGFGPRLGMDLFYNLNQSLTVYGKAATTLLVGSNKFNQSTTGSYTAAATKIYTVTGPIDLVSSGSNTKIVPELDATAGISYTFSRVKNSITVDAGWVWANYFNAQGVSASPHGLLGRGLPMQAQLNFQIQGGYLGVQWLGDMA